MGKQIVNSSNGISPKKNFMPDMKVNGSIDDEHNDNVFLLLNSDKHESTTYQ
jgi:hypothetical protein